MGIFGLRRGEGGDNGGGKVAAEGGDEEALEGGEGAFAVGDAEWTFLVDVPANFANIEMEEG